MRVDVVKEGRDPNNDFGTGTIVRVTCAKEYRLNVPNSNGTAKCVRGRWKPVKPECTLVPCSIASTEHGTYVALVDQKDDGKKSATQPLNAIDEVQSGETVQFSCDDGYTVQGPTKLKCTEGSWDVSGLPECVPAPCSLPVINNAVYQVFSINASTLFVPNAKHYYFRLGWISFWVNHCSRRLRCGSV